MNTLRVNRITRRDAPGAGILARLRSLMSPARLMNSMNDAMHAEQTGALEIAEAWRTLGVIDQSGNEAKITLDDEITPGPGNVAPSHAELLLRSACDVLCSQSAGAISATALSLPTEPGITTHNLTEMASLMAIEYGVLADASVDGNHVHVRLTRRVPPVPDKTRANEEDNSDPISGRGRKRGRN